MGNFGQTFEIRDIQLGIANGFCIDGAGVCIYCILKGFQVLGIDKFCGPPQFREGIVQKFVGAAVKVVSGNNIITWA